MYANELKSYIRDMNGAEIDVVIFGYDNQDPNRSHILEIEMERKIVLETPFAIIAEVTLQGSERVLKQKIQQLIKGLIFFRNFFRLNDSRFGNHKEVLRRLLQEGKLNMYPFISIDGIL